MMKMTTDIDTYLVGVTKFPMPINIKHQLICLDEEEEIMDDDSIEGLQIVINNPVTLSKLQKSVIENQLIEISIKLPRVKFLRIIVASYQWLKKLPHALVSFKHLKDLEIYSSNQQQIGQFTQSNFSLKLKRYSIDFFRKYIFQYEQQNTQSQDELISLKDTVRINCFHLKNVYVQLVLKEEEEMPQEARERLSSLNEYGQSRLNGSNLKYMPTVLKWGCEQLRYSNDEASDPLFPLIKDIQLSRLRILICTECQIESIEALCRLQAPLTHLFLWQQNNFYPFFEKTILGNNILFGSKREQVCGGRYSSLSQFQPSSFQQTHSNTLLFSNLYPFKWTNQLTGNKESVFWNVNLLNKLVEKHKTRVCNLKYTHHQMTKRLKMIRKLRTYIERQVRSSPWEKQIVHIC